MSLLRNYASGSVSTIQQKTFSLGASRSQLSNAQTAHHRGLLLLVQRFLCHQVHWCFNVFDCGIGILDHLQSRFDSKHGLTDPAMSPASCPWWDFPFLQSNSDGYSKRPSQPDAMHHVVRSLELIRPHSKSSGSYLCIDPPPKAFRLKPVDALSPPLVNPPAQVRTMNQLKPEQRKQSCSIPLAMNYPRIVILGIAWVAVTLAPAWANVVAGQEVKYTDLRSIRALTPSDPLGALVDFEATVTFVDGMREFLFVQEGQDAIFVYRPDVSSVKPGQRVQVRGRLTKGDLLPIVSDSVVTVIGTGNLVEPKSNTRIGIEDDCKYLTFEFDILQAVVSAEETLLYAKTEAKKDVCILVRHRAGIEFPNVSRIAGHRIQCRGVLGLLVSGGAFLEPGKNQHRIDGYKVFCNSPADLKIVGENNSTDSGSAPMVGLSFLERDDFPEGRFLTFAQICLIDYVESEFVVFDGSTAIRLKLPSTGNLKPGMIMRIGGIKRQDQAGQPQFEVDYMRHLNLGEFPQPEPITIDHAVKTFTPDRRIAVEGRPRRIENRDGQRYLILAEGDSTIAVHFQEAAKDSLTPLDPSIAQKVRITGVSKEDQQYGCQLVVVRPDDVMLLERKTSVSRMVAIGLGLLLAVCGLAALWIKLLRDKVAQQQRFESIFDNAGCPIVVFNGNLQIIDANQLAADMTGYSKDELRHMKVSQIDMHLPEQTVRMQLVQTMRNQTVSIFPTKVSTKDLKELDVEVHCRNLGASEDPDKATYIAIFPDVTERIKYENELKEARDEAIKANKSKSQFVAAMSHELRTPLNGVIGMTQLLESTELTPTQADYLAACRTSGETLLTVIGDVLDFSKMEAGKLELELQETKLIPFIENVVRATNLQQGTRHVDLGSFVDPRLSRSVMVDSNRLRQVLFNLIGNAAKFTAKGSITVTARCSEVNEQYADIRFVVSDTGVGIPEDRIDGLFEAFEQCDSSTTREYGGTGLGLTICREIVGLMDGKIHAQSVLGEGSDFIVEVRLPFASQERTYDEGQIAIVPTDKRVAVVGMSEPISKLLHEMFDEYNVNASFFGDSQILLKDEFDVVLLNSIDGLESVGKFMEQQQYAMACDGAPILIPVVPANCVVEQQQWELKGAVQPLLKPFTQTRFVQPVNSRQESHELPGADRLRSSKLQNRSLRVLICEDNAVNQMFAKEICRRAGIKVVICENGQVGIETLKLDTRFDAILMDCHMPVMDGFEASRKIREMTELGMIPKIPVIALTANAFAGDRERCLKAGMDDYLTKPFEIEGFLDKIHVNIVEPADGNPADTDGQNRDAIFNLEKLLGQIDDKVFVLSIAEQFAASLPGYEAALQACLEKQDSQLTYDVSHRLKGTAATVSADRISNLAAEIESAARDGQLDQLQAQVSKILQEFESFTNVVGEEVAAG